MDSSLLPAFVRGFALSASLIVSIGAQNMFVLRQGLKREHVLPIVVFCAAADASLIIAGVNGLGAMLALIPGLAFALSIAGAAFLCWYGVAALRRAGHASAMVVENAGGLSLGGALAGTAAFTFLNPHVYIDTVMLMGAVGSSLPDLQRPYFLVGASLFGVLWFTALGYGARLLVPIFARPLAWRVLDSFTGLMMFAIAAVLLLGAGQP